MNRSAIDSAGIRIRRADAGDLPALAAFGVRLAELHVSFDDRRFIAPDPAEPVFFRFFEAELARPESVLLIAELGDAPAGYAFVRVEKESLEDLRGRSAWLHDIFVDPEARGQGIGKQLVEAAIKAARSLGSDNLMLSVSPKNSAGQRLFKSLGLRITMMEMRIDLEES